MNTISRIKWPLACYVVATAATVYALAAGHWFAGFFGIIGVAAFISLAAMGDES